MYFLQDMTTDELQAAYAAAKAHAFMTAKKHNPCSYQHLFSLTSIISIEREIRERRLEAFLEIRHANVFD